MKYKQIFLVISLLMALFAINACEEPLKQSDLDLKEEPTLDGVMSSLTNGSSESVADTSTSSETVLSSGLKVSSSGIIDTSKSSGVVGSSTVLSSGVGLSSSSLLSSSAAIVLDTVKAVKMSPAGGTFTSNTKVILTSTTVGSQIRYTLDGTTPIESSSVYKDSILVSGSLTLKTSAFKSGMVTSPFTEGVFEITGTVAPPTFSIDPNTYTTAQTVALSTITSGATIYYTTDGSIPSASSAKYSSAIIVKSTKTLKAIAIKNDWINSPVITGIYTITGKVANPVFGLNEGSYTTSQSVTITTTTPGSAIYYTVDGSKPSSSSPVYGSAISVVGTQTIKAVAVKSDWANSDMVSSSYVITGKMSIPVISPPTGTYTSAQSVKITAESGASIYYTTDGSIPTTSSKKYLFDYGLNSTTTIKAIAAKVGWDNSDVATSTITITGKVGTPSVTPKGGTHVDSVMVSFASSTLGVTFYFTLDGTNPTTSSFTSTSFLLKSSKTVKVIAVKSGWSNSDISSVDFTIQTYCEANPSRCFVDERDKKIYRTTVMGTQIWMAENLNYGTYAEEIASSSHYQTGAQKFCYSNNPSNCDSDGGLYQWHTAMGLTQECSDGSKFCSDQISTGNHQGICPEGWHIPKNFEWDELVSQLGGVTVAAEKMKSSEFGGTDDFGFTALATGYRYYNGGFSWRGSQSYFWGADEDDKYDGFYWKLNKGNNSFVSYPYYKKTGASIRCIKD
jgi:uncharacterized protein (TIGR02145 family)